MPSTSLPEVIGWRLLSDPIGLSWAVGGAVLWAQLFLGAVLCWKLEKAPGVLPLLRCITDGQSPLLLGAGKKRKQRHRSLTAAFSTCFRIAAFKWPDDDAAHPGHQNTRTSRTLLPGSEVMSGTDQQRWEPVKWDKTTLSFHNYLTKQNLKYSLRTSFTFV